MGSLQISMLNQVSQVRNSSTGVIAFPAWPLVTAKHTCLSCVPKASSRATGPHPFPLQQTQKVDQPSSSPLSYRGCVLQEASLWLSWGCSASLRAPRRHPTHYNSMAQRGQEVLKSAQQPYLGAVPMLISAVSSTKWLCYLWPMSWSTLLLALGPPNRTLYVTHIEACPKNTSKGQVLHSSHPHVESVQCK